MEFEFEAAAAYINQLLSTQYKILSEDERTVLRAAWDRLTYPQAAAKFNRSENTLRGTVAPKLFPTISDLLNQRVKKTSFRKIITDRLEVESAESAAQKPIEHSETKTTHEKSMPRVVGAKPPNVQKFYGRKRELKELKQCIDKYRCISLIGVEGIGKRTLLARLLQTVKLPFSQIVWKPVHHSPSVDVLESEMLQLLRAEGSSLISLFTQQPYLLILESIDALLDYSGPSKALDKGYTSLIRRVIEETQSRIVLISCEPIPETQPWAFRGDVILYPLGGLTLEASRKIFREAGLPEDGESWDKTIASLGYNPLLMKQVANWHKHELDSGDPSLVARETIQFGVTQGWRERLFQGTYLSEIDQQILLDIANSNSSIPYKKLILNRGSAISNISRLIQIGLVEQINIDNQKCLKITSLLRRHLLENAENLKLLA